MKIMNQTNSRTVSEDENSIQKTPISELKSTTEMFPTSLFHIVQNVSGDSESPLYESMKIKVGYVQQKMYEAVQNTFKTRYDETHSHDGTNEPSGTSFKEMLDYLADTDMGEKWTFPPEKPAEDAVDGFVKHVNYDIEILRRYIVKKDADILGSVSTIHLTLSKIDYAFASTMVLTSTNKDGGATHISVNHRKTENDSFCQMKIEVGNKISNKWIVPADGQLVVYGWLDSSKLLNNKATPGAFCVLEGKINSTDGYDNWEILSVCSVAPAKNMTYVSFNVPVHQGLEIRARTGFTVGAKSSQYSNEQDGYDSLANSTANGFKCQVYSHRNYKEEG